MVTTSSSRSRPPTPDRIRLLPSSSRKKFCATIGSVEIKSLGTGYSVGYRWNGRKNEPSAGDLLLLADPEDDELGRLDRRDADLDHQLALVDRLRGVGLGVALHEERFFGGLPEESPGGPEAAQETVQRALHAFPQRHVVRLEDGPLGALENRRLDHVEQPPDVDVAPVRIRGQGARAPDADSPCPERADAVDPDRV